MNKKHQFAIDIAVGAEALYRAFTEETLLTQWLTESARVSLAEGVFELWGRYLPGAPREPITRFLDAADNRSLRFTMLVRGVETVVSAQFSDSGVTIEQDKVKRAAGEVAMEDFWGGSLENLRRLLTGGSAPFFRDFTPPCADAASLQVEIAAPAAKVFGALVEPAQLDRYLAEKAEVNPVEGGKIDFGWGTGPIKLLTVDPDREVSYSWQDDTEPETVVTWTLEGSDGGTRLTLVHSGFGAKRATDDYSTGWWFFVNSLKSMLEMGAPWTRARVHGNYTSPNQ
jgi:uncharacterized protein YndB with AHSA1/START domain